MSATFLANTWANAHFTMQTSRPRWRSACRIYLGSIALTSAALFLVDAAGAGLGAQISALVVTWTVATIGRLALVRRASTRRVRGMNRSSTRPAQDDASTNPALRRRPGRLHGGLHGRPGDERAQHRGAGQGDVLAMHHEMAPSHLAERRWLLERRGREIPKPVLAAPRPRLFLTDPGTSPS